MKRVLTQLLLSLLVLLPLGAVQAAGTPDYRITHQLPLPGDGGWDYLTADSAGRRLYVSHATHVVVVDLDAGKVVGDIPDTPGVLETTRMVVAVKDSPKPPPQRITLTLPAIQRSREVWLMVSGAAKADAAAAAIGGAPPVSIPAAGAVGLETTLWLLDAEAAAKLPG